MNPISKPPTSNQPITTPSHDPPQKKSRSFVAYRIDFPATGLQHANRRDEVSCLTEMSTYPACHPSPSCHVQTCNKIFYDLKLSGVIGEIDSTATCRSLLAFDFEFSSIDMRGRAYNVSMSSGN